MLQHLPSIPVIVAVLAAALASFSRVFQASRPAWGSLPAWVQTLAPTLLAACGAIVSGLAGVTTPTDLMVVLVAGFMVLLPGLPSNRSAAPMQAGKPATSTPSAGDVAVASALASGTIKPAAPKAPSMPPVVGMMLLCFLAFALTACGLLAAVSPYLAEAGVLIADASNAVSVAEASHLVDADLIARARATLAAAAAADNGAQDLTAEQLDASLAAFRAAWTDIQQAYAAKHIGGAEGGTGLPVPQAVRRVYK